MTENKENRDSKENREAEINQEVSEFLDDST